MSLKEAYSLAHTAQCRLQIEVGRRDRNLRFVVGHLMHYESLRLRIVEIEHDISKSETASTVAFQGTGHVASNELRRKGSSGQLGRRPLSPPPSTTVHDDNDDDDDLSSDEDEMPDDLLVDDEEDGLGLTRFPSGASRPPQMPPDLAPDDDDDDDDDDVDEPPSPEQLSSDIIDECIQGESDRDLARSYNSIRACPCHGDTDAVPVVERIWELPPDKVGAKDGDRKRLAIAQVG